MLKKCRFQAKCHFFISFRFRPKVQEDITASFNMMEIWGHESTEFLRIERLNEVFLGIQLLAKLTV